MDSKGREALQRWGAKKILVDLANLPAADGQKMEFVERYGPLRSSAGIPMGDPLAEVLKWAPKFRQAWTARTEREMEEVGNFLDEIFGPQGSFFGIEYGVRADFARGTWEPAPRTLLDVLALELMRSRKMLHRCERPECGRYFVKEFSRDRYCSNLCSDAMRKAGQREWAREHRASGGTRRKKGKKK